MWHCETVSTGTHPLLCLVAHALLQLAHVIIPLCQLLLQGGNLRVGGAQLTLIALGGHKQKGKHKARLGGGS
jgi:hypothetical protein